jgi:hypothetical protein
MNRKPCAAFRHHHVKVVREFALYDLETGAAFAARHRNTMEQTKVRKFQGPHGATVLQRLA